MFRAVFMDIDGTMLDSNLAHARAWSIALEEEGYRIPAERVLPLIGMGSEKVVLELTGFTKDSAEGAAIIECRGEVFNERFVDDLQPFPRVRELVEHWTERGLVLGVATSGKAEDARRLLERAGVDDLFACRVTGDDVENSKPDPDILSVALKRCAVPAPEVVMVGDTPYDVQAASAAGIACIGVRCGGWSTEALHGTIAVFADPAELLARSGEPPLTDWFPAGSARRGGAEGR